MNRNFNKIYENIYSNGIEAINLYKKKRLGSALVFIIVTMLVIVLFNQVSLLNEFVIVIGVALVFVTFINFLHTDSNYKKMFKSSIMQEIIHSYSPKFRYNQNNGVRRSEFIKSGFKMRFDEFYSEDLIEGPIDEETYFRMSQIKLVKAKYEMDRNGNPRRKGGEIVFQGLFGIVDVPRKVLTSIELLFDRSENRYNKNRIEIDSQEFEKQYDLFATDKIRAMEIFTADVIEEINGLKEDTGYTIHLRVTHNKVFFKIKCGEAFEPPLIKNATDYSALYKYFRMIDSPISIAEKIVKNAEETHI